MSIIRMMILAALLIYGIHLGQAFTTEYRNNTTANVTENNTTMDAFTILIGDEQTFPTYNVVEIGMMPSHKPANTDLYEGLHLTREQAFNHNGPFVTYNNVTGSSFLNPIENPVVPVIGFH